MSIKLNTAAAPASNPATDALRLKAINAELLAALENITKYVDACTQHNRWTDIEWLPIIAKARAAIAQARKASHV